MVYYDLNVMTDEAYLRQMDEAFVMFSTDGWKLFTSEIKQTLDNLDKISVTDVRTIEHLHSLRGQIQSLNLVLNYPTMLKQAYEGLSSKLEDAADEAV